MVIHTSAFTESVDQTLDNIAALADGVLHTNGDDLFVPDGLGHILAVRIGSATAERGRINTASLREGAGVLPDLHPVGISEPESPPAGFHEWWDTPLPLVPKSPGKGERLKVLIENDGAGAGEQATAVVWLGDGPVKPSPGNCYSIRATNTSTLTANAWTNGTLTLAQELPRGEYELVGARAQSAGLQAARFVFPGQSYRPGILGCDADADIGAPIFRRGRMGVFGRFAYDQPPTVDFLSISADTSQQLVLDVRKVG